MAANVDTGCDMTEEEILAMLKGISVKRQEARDVDAVTASATDNAGTRAAAVVVAARAVVAVGVVAVRR